MCVCRVETIQFGISGSPPKADMVTAQIENAPWAKRSQHKCRPITTNFTTQHTLKHIFTLASHTLPKECSPVSNLLPPRLKVLTSLLENSESLTSAGVRLDPCTCARCPPPAWTGSHAANTGSVGLRTGGGGVPAAHTWAEPAAV